LVQSHYTFTMAHITPFRALRYDPARVAISAVATQPYDKITPEMQARYYAASPYNLVRIILGKRNATDSAKDNPYTRAAEFFRDWRAKGIFLQDPKPSIYRYTQRFTVPGTKSELERKGFIALGKVEDYSSGVVFRHEETLAKPKADRLDLLRATRALFGQIFMLYSDPGSQIENALSKTGRPDLELRDEYEVLHQVWRVSEPEILALVTDKMQQKKLIIADGHHRYETALNYRNERRAAAAGAGGGDGASSHSRSQALSYEFAMMTFINMDSPGLLILPTHRVVHGLSAFAMKSFRQGAGKYFSVEEVDSSIDASPATSILKEAAHTGTALIAVARDRVFLLSRPKAPAEVFGGLSFRQQRLDVVQLHKCVLERVLGISEEAIREQTNITYIRDAGEAMNMVREGNSDVAFLMNPARIEQVRDIAFAGEVLPQKSTDFYPKLLSGLTVYALE
jgi:uncharacterized protein (DUF1015 family)